MKIQERGQVLHTKKRRKKTFVTLLVIILIVGALGGGGFAVYKNFLETPDYLASELAEPVVVKIPEGATATEIAEILYNLDVVKSIKAFVNVALEHKNTHLEFGNYNLYKHMPAEDAYTALLDKANLVTVSFNVTEGKTVYQTVQIIAESTDYSVDELNTAVETAKSKLPAGVTSMEGWLFPANYSFDYDTTAQEAIDGMLEKTYESLKIAEVPEDRYEEIITKASIIQKEVATVADMAKVSRVIENRLEDGMTLGMDAITAYGTTGGMGGQGLELLQDDLDDPNAPYNSHKQKGLPPTPISNPGLDAIKAALNPAEGNWFYYVTVNPDTGETVFTDSENEFETLKAQYKTWCAANPTKCGQ